jgi:hypothetical protein
VQSTIEHVAQEIEPQPYLSGRKIRYNIKSDRQSMPLEHGIRMFAEVRVPIVNGQGDGSGRKSATGVEVRREVLQPDNPVVTPEMVQLAIEQIRAEAPWIQGAWRPEPMEHEDPGQALGREPSKWNRGASERQHHYSSTRHRMRKVSWDDSKDSRWEVGFAIGNEQWWNSGRPLEMLADRPVEPGREEHRTRD